MAIRFGLPRCGALAVLAFFCASCSTVASKKVAYAAGGDFNAEASGLTYFLPMRPVKVTASRTPRTLADLTKTAAAKEKDATEAQQAAKDAKQKAETAEAIWKALADNSPAKAEAAIARDKAKAEQQLAETAATKAQQDKEIATAYVELARAGVLCSYSIKLDLQPAQADPSARFVAKLTHNPFRDDTAKLAVTNAGLLSSANVVAADRTGDILVEFAGASIAMGKSWNANMLETTKKACASPPFTAIINPAENLGPLNTALAKADFPYMIIAASSFAGLLTPADDKFETLAPKAPSSTPDADGGRVYYRTPTPYMISVRQCDAAPCTIDKSDPVEAAIFMLPQAGPVSFVPMNSSAFVKTTNDVQFEDGVLKSWNADRPSEVLEVVRLPVKILTAIISVPAQLLSLKIDYSSKDKTRLDTQQAQMKSENAMKDLKECIAKAEQDQVSATSCFK